MHLYANKEFAIDYYLCIIKKTNRWKQDILLKISAGLITKELLFSFLQ